MSTTSKPAVTHEIPVIYFDEFTDACVVSWWKYWLLGLMWWRYKRLGKGLLWKV